MSPEFPLLLPFQIANVCWAKGPTRSGLLAQHRKYEALAVRELDVDGEEVTKLTLRTGLTAYGLARQLGADLVTLDKALIRAAVAQPRPAPKPLPDPGPIRSDGIF